MSIVLSPGTDQVLNPCVSVTTTVSSAASQLPGPDTEASGPGVRLQTVVHIEFSRMSRHAQARDILHLEADVRIDHIVREHAATL